ncbi:hypothetical protein [Aurantiacibacter sediminis]|uniref:Uncharacterized protein n=1 Tax=Aurantiacibacter sediminis TaxID=2793064 RepID=A0ABS0N253_9SPHN|nr:hypothetical protein [Aurantiacibacter sediminis]MBH5322027.1 hypothetical protein [Aurantiacibacter sediminis]
MQDILQQYWIFILIALVFLFLLIFWLLQSSRRTKVTREDIVDGESSIKRNQALIDAPAAAAGPVSAAANTDRVAAAPVEADSEAGAGVSPLEARNASETPAAPAEAADENGDDLRRIKGLGPKLVTILHDNGVRRFAQIAAWDDADIERMDAKLGRFQGRIRRDNWVEQAQFLAKDDLAGYNEKYGNL